MATTSEQQSTKKAEDFLSCMKEKLHGARVGIAIAMGMQTGLFDVMVSLGGEPKTSREIADAGNFKERYVREWLACIASARIVNFNPDDEKYWLPSNRSTILELKSEALVVPVLCGGFFPVAECFKTDGPSGVSYSHYKNFDELMLLMQGPWFHNHFIQDFIASMPNIKNHLEEGIQVLDVGCGAGLSTRVLASHFPNSRFCGVDLSKSAVCEATNTAAEKGLTNVEFTQGDVSELPLDWTARFDYVLVIFVLHALSYPNKATNEIHRVLKPGGTLSIIEVDAHSQLKDNLILDQNRMIEEYTFSLMCCLPTSLVREDGAGLGSCWGREEAQKLLEKSNFDVVSINEAQPGSMHIMCKKP